MRKQVGDIHTSSPLMDQCARHPFGVCYVLGSDAKSWGVSNLGALVELSSQKLLSMNVPCYLERGPCLFCSSRNPWSYLHTFPPSPYFVSRTIWPASTASSTQFPPSFLFPRSSQPSFPSFASFHPSFLQLDVYFIIYFPFSQNLLVRNPVHCHKCLT